VAAGQVAVGQVGFAGLGDLQARAASSATTGQGATVTCGRGEVSYRAPGLGGCSPARPMTGAVVGTVREQIAATDGPHEVRAPMVRVRRSALAVIARLAARVRSDPASGPHTHVATVAVHRPRPVPKARHLAPVGQGSGAAEVPGDPKEGDPKATVRGETTATGPAGGGEEAGTSPPFQSPRRPRLPLRRLPRQHPSRLCRRLQATTAILRWPWRAPPRQPRQKTASAFFFSFRRQATAGRSTRPWVIPPSEGAGWAHRRRSGPRGRCLP
jgi:hypothetical protein